MPTSSLNEAIKSVSFQSDKTLRKILFSYWLVVLLAVPLWWTTTSITRLSLPEGRVNALDAKQLAFSLNVTFDASLPGSIVKDVEDGLGKRVRDRRLDDTLSVSISSGSPRDSGVYRVSVDGELNGAHLEERHLTVGTKSVSSQDIPELITDTLTNLLFADFGRQDQQVMQYAPRYRLAFSLMNEDAGSGNSPLGWDVKAAIERDIKPVLQRLSALHNFTIESQVQFFAPLAFKPIELEKGGFGLTQEQLTVFVNSEEWTLSSSISNDPVLHFIVFVPSATRRHLRILDNNGLPTASTAFIIPQWGSIFICNPEKLSHTSLSPRDLRLSFSVFRTQLLKLLGIPPLPAGVHTREALSDWQLDSLLRQRAYENAKGSKDTLSSIVSLVSQIEGMPVGKDVTDDVRDALDALDKMYKVARESPRLALHYSARALTRASRAFFNPGMLALLYFPPEHNVAVYTPLLAPVTVPLLAAVLREIKNRRRQRRG
ncbi:hypothetical protein M0805_009538 [Coniferiporia weirii]|nr:hypothetical protein M0805_009538 [Coniferiporia weirii]